MQFRLNIGVKKDFANLVLSKYLHDFSNNETNHEQSKDYVVIGLYQ